MESNHCEGLEMGSVSVGFRLYSEFPIHPPHRTQAAPQGTKIRLLELRPTFMGDSIICNMHCTTLPTNRKFIALSYAWGKTEKTHTIHVRGYPIAVTQNLHQALICLRHPQDSVTLWIDAICIDQSNLQERNYQVKQMPNIYRAAQEVVAWLGESTYQSNAAMELITLSPEELQKRLRQGHLIVRTYLDDLFSRAYWGRVWVVQELSSSRRACILRCGDKSVTLDQFREFLRGILRQIKFSDLRSMTRPRSLMALSTPDPSRTFLHVLWESSSLQSTEVLDRIYGIRGISPKFYQDNIEVDYTVDFEQLCRKIMVLMINKERSLEVLCYFSRYSVDYQSTSPSWLRDFSKRNSGISPNMYSCDKGRKANAKIVNGILRTRGIRISKVENSIVFSKATREVYWPRKARIDLKPESRLKAITTLVLDAIESNYPQETEQCRKKRFWEMFAGGKQQEWEGLGEIYQRDGLQKLWDKRIAYDEGTISSTEWQQFDEHFCNTFVRLLGRCVFMTIEGNVGVGPRDVQEEDVVCILYGCKLPVILRKDGRYYKFIGPAYIDGAMNGEFIEEGDKGHRFWIR
jgi:hypothetical protein